jgi:hypothetical protein
MHYSLETQETYSFGEQSIKIILSRSSIND